MNHKVVFTGIIILAALLRLLWLGSIPAGIYADEASSGYDAFSLLHTGSDRHGEFLPLLFRSFGDYIPPVYNYSIIPFAALLDLDAWSTRLPAALFGIGGVILTFFITRKLASERAALIASAFIAVSPWHLQFSRIAFPAISLSFFFLLAFFFLLKSRDDARYLVPAAFAFGISLHTYAVAKLFMPLFLMGFFIIYRRYFTVSLRLIAPLVIALLFAAPAYYLSFFGPGNERFSQLSIFAEERPFALFSSNFLSHLSPDFLFISGDGNLRHSIKGFGQLHWFLLPLILIGLFLLLRNIRRPSHQLLLLWLLLFPVAASVTAEGNPHAVRSIVAVPLFEIIAAIGAYQRYRHLAGRRRLLLAIAAISIVAALANTGLYLQSYFGDYPRYSKDLFQDKLADGFAALASRERDYARVIISDSLLPEPEIYVLFYTRYDPAAYQRSRLAGSKYLVDNIWIHPYDKDRLYLVMPYEMGNVPAQETIAYDDGEPAFRIV